MFWKKIILITLILCGAIFTGIGQAGFPVPTGNKNQLFYLQRTSNHNTIVYELNYKNGILDKANPVHEFWIRYQEKGQREELSYIQKKFAYGIKVKKIRDNHYELSLAAYKKYKLYLEPGPGNRLHVYTHINQKKMILTSIFLKLNGGTFWSPNIEYVEVSGIDPQNSSVVKEKLKI